jgi:adenine-specific DNA methylase
MNERVLPPKRLKGVNIMTTQRSLAMTLGVAAIAVLAAGSAFADDPTPDRTAQVVSQKSRAEVASELAQARRDGSAKLWSFSYQNKVQNLVRSEKVRTDVKSEVLAARRTGELNAFVGEDSGSFWLARQAAAQQRVRRNLTAE